MSNKIGDSINNMADPNNTIGMVNTKINGTNTKSRLNIPNPTAAKTAVLTLLKDGFASAFVISY